MTSTDPFSENHEKTPSLKFTTKDSLGQTQILPVGTRLGGRVVKAPEIVQSREYVPGGGVGKLQYWDQNKKGAKTTEPNDQPVRSIVTVLETAEGTRSLWTSFYPKFQFEAIQKAIAEAGAEKIEVGGELYVTVAGAQPNEGKFPSILYSAEYKAPNAFAGDSTASPTSSTVPAPPAPAAAAPAPPPAPPAAPTSPAQPVTTPEGYTMASLMAAGWSHEQIVAQYPMLGAPAAPSVPPAPPAPPAPPSGDDARAAALARMSDEDLALLKMNRDGSPMA